MTAHSINELISGYLDGVLSAEQQAELSKWIESDPAHADQFAEAILFDNRLHAEVNATLYMDGAAATAASLPQRSDVGYPTRIFAAIAACLLIGIGITYWISTRNVEGIAEHENEAETNRGFASVTHVLDANGDGKSGLSIGDRLSSQTIQLQSGFVSLVFDDGVEVTLQGPAEYELLALAKTKLTSGLLTATVPPGAEGFTVDTPTAEVVDLGTSFGIDLREDGFSSVSVFDGEVEVAVPDAAEKHLLTEGESVRIGADRKIEKVDIDPERYAKVWPIFSGIVGSSEAFRFVPPWPKRIRFVTSDNDIFIATEGYAVDLNSELKVNITEPGDYARVNELTPLELPAGERVRSYILHYSPTTQVGPRRAKRVSGSITFDRPVLGVIVEHEELLASSRRFTRRSAGEGQHRRELNLIGDDAGDRITLSKDRKTVTLDLISPGKSSDLVRVIVDSSDGFRPPKRRNRSNRATGSQRSTGNRI